MRKTKQSRCAFSFGAGPEPFGVGVWNGGKRDTHTPGLRGWTLSGGQARGAWVNKNNRTGLVVGVQADG